VAIAPASVAETYEASPGLFLVIDAEGRLLRIELLESTSSTRTAAGPRRSTT
jgi:hypothetical protein